MHERSGIIIMSLTLRKKHSFTPSQIGAACFYVFWIVLMIGKGLGYTSSAAAFRIMTWAVLPFAVLKMALTKWTRNELIICFLLDMLGIAVWISSGSADILLTAVAVTSSKGIDIHRIFKLTFWIRGVMFLVRSSLFILGVLEDTVSYRYSSGIVSERYALGYGHPNSAQYTLFIIVALALILYGSRMKWWHYLVLFIYDFFIFSYTDSRTGFFITAACLAAGFLISRKPFARLRRWTCILGIYIWILGAVFSFAVCFLFSGSQWMQSQGTLTSRFRDGFEFMTSYRLSLFGLADINSDFGYIDILYSRGIITFVLFMAGFIIMGKIFQKKGMYMESLILSAYAVYTLLESYSASILMNFLLLYFSCLIFRKNRDGLEWNRDEAQTGLEEKS